MSFSALKRDLENWPETRLVGEPKFISTFVWRKWLWFSLFFTVFSMASLYAFGTFLMNASISPSAVGLIVAALTIFLAMQITGYVVALFIWRINEFLYSRKD